MKGLWMVARREILSRGRSKSYLVSLLASAVLVVGLTLLPSILDGENNYKVLVTGTDATQLEETIEVATADIEGFTVEVSQVDDAEAGRALIAEGEADVVIVDNQSLISESGADQELSVILEGVHQSVASRHSLSDAGLTTEQINDALLISPLTEDHLGGDDAGARQGIAYFLVIVLFFMVMMPTMYVAMGVVEEKSSRIVEILLSSLKTWQLLGGKIFGLGVLGFVNLAVPVAVGLVAGTATGAVADLPPGLTTTILSVLGWWVLGFGFFAAMAGALASLISRQEDMNSAIGPMTMLMVGSYLVASIYVWDPTSTVARVLSFIPPFSMFLMPVRDAVNDAPVWQQLASAGLMAVAVVGMFALGATIYKRSVMRTGSKIKFSEVFAKSA